MRDNRVKIGAILLCGASFYASQSLAADPSVGGQIYSRNCTTCHGDDGRGTMPGVPDFTRGDALLKPNNMLAASIRSGKELMPAFQGLLSDKEINDVVAYLRSFR
ncbi:MAG: cytochrome c class I [Halothiobacillaceae bacterium]|nr:MAG: cytochrome c class I [Halothiobacillaceae bacterium]